MAATPQRGAGIGLPLLNLAGSQNARGIAAGSVHTCPAGNYYFFPGAYTVLEYLDPITGLWRGVQPYSMAPNYIVSDGANFRISNRSGTPVGAVVTAVGSGYTSTPVVTAGGTGGSIWQAIVGGAINTTLVVGTAGVGYNYPPNIIISAPPPGGVQATAHTTLSGGVPTAVVDNQGAGYLVAPTVTVVADPRDATAVTPGPTTPATWTVNSTLVGAGTVTAVVCTNQGNAVTAVPTLTISGGGGSSATATAIMAFAATGIGSVTGGAGFGNAQPFGVITTGGVVAATAAAGSVNPLLGTGIFIPRQASMTGTSTAGGAITATGLVINDPGLFQAVPTAMFIATGTGLISGAASATVTVGGVADSYILQPV